MSPKQNQGRQDFTVLTINGRVRLWRRRWYSPGEGTSTPLDSWRDTLEGAIRLGVRGMAGRLNGDGKNFDKAAVNLGRTARIPLSGETLRVLVEAEGKRVLVAQRSGRLAVEWSAAECRVAPKAKSSPMRVDWGSDGVMVPLATDAEKASRRPKIKQTRRKRGKKARPLPPQKAGADQGDKEFTIVAFDDEAQDHRLVTGTRGDCGAAGPLMRREAARLPFDRAGERVGTVDGSPWLRNPIERQGLPRDDSGLDFYHLGEDVHKARRAIDGEEDPAGKGWAGDLLHRFQHDGDEAARKQWLEWRVGLHHGRPAADRLVNYVSERREMIKYPGFQAQGWQIGSGPTEATCKALTARLKGSGMRRDADNAEALMAPEALTQSGQWAGHWKSRLRPTG